MWVARARGGLWARGRGVLAYVKPRLLTVDQFIDLPARPDLEWIVPKLFPKPGLVMLMGEPKAGKSFLGTDVGRRIAAGEPVLGVPCSAARVLYIQMDNREPVWRQTLRDLRESGVVFHENFVIVHPEDQKRPLNILQSDTKQWFDEVLEAAQPAFVVLDVLREMHNGEENDSTSMKIVMDVVESTFKKYSVLVLHHSKKLADDVVDPSMTNASRGSSYITGKMDSLWLLRKEMLKIDSRFDEVRKLRAVRLANGLWEFPEQWSDQTNIEKVLALCEEFPALEHAQLWPIAKQRGLVNSRPTFYRHHAGRVCRHTPKHGVVSTIEEGLLLLVILDECQPSDEGRPEDDCGIDITVIPEC